MAQQPAHIEVEDISKRFGGVQALADVSLSIPRGQIHGLVGENGAGKSTLGKIISGVLPFDDGRLVVNGQEAHYRSPRDALIDGITMITQEVSLVPARSVIENVYLGREPHRSGLVRRNQLRVQYNELNIRVGFDLPADTPVRSLRLADQQKVEILRALARDAELIIMDEPTAALTTEEAKKLFEIVRNLNEQGVTVIYISHFLEEVLDLVETVSILKDGRLVRTRSSREESPEALVTAMIGRRIDLSFPAKQFPAPGAPVVFSCQGLNRRGVIENISFEIRQGEIVGLAGLIGSGRSEVARAIFGADPRDSSSSLILAGKAFRARGPRQAIRAGVAFLPESRKDDGLMMDRPLIENISLPHLDDVATGPLVSGRAERSRVSDLLRRLNVRADSLSAEVTTLSGGNQQKVLFAKWLFKSPLLLLADEPTRGIDVGAKHAIYNLIKSLAANGMAVLVISSEHEEILGLAHRILVMRQGTVVAELDGSTASADDVLRAAFATGWSGEAPSMPHG